MIHLFLKCISPKRMTSLASDKNKRECFPLQPLFIIATLIVLLSPVECFVSCFRRPLAQERYASWSDTGRHQNPSGDRSLCRCHEAVSPGDTVVVFGATGGIGQLVTRKLLEDGYDVRVVARNATSAASVLSLEATTMPGETRQRGTLKIEQLSLLDNGNEEALRAALQGASGVVLSLGTTAFPSSKWAGGNTPNAIDNMSIRKISSALQTNEKQSMKVVLVTSVGVKRTKDFPFIILNLFGVLDAKRSGEEAIQEAAAASGGTLDYAIIRPGRLVGGPYTNLDLAKLMQIEGGTENGVILARGDALLGDCKRDACAEAVMQCLTNNACKNLDFSVVSSEERSFTNSQWTESFLSMSDPIA